MNTPANEVSKHPRSSAASTRSRRIMAGKEHTNRHGDRTMIGLIGGLTALLVAASALHAGELSVMAGQSI